MLNSWYRVKSTGQVGRCFWEKQEPGYWARGRNGGRYWRGGYHRLGLKLPEVRDVLTGECEVVWCDGAEVTLIDGDDVPEPAGLTAQKFRELMTRSLLAPWDGLKKRSAQNSTAVVLAGRYAGSVGEVVWLGYDKAGGSVERLGLKLQTHGTIWLDAWQVAKVERPRGSKVIEDAWVQDAALNAMDRRMTALMEAGHLEAAETWGAHIKDYQAWLKDRAEVQEAVCVAASSTRPER